MKNFTRQIISGLLVMAMLFGIMPAAPQTANVASAAGADEVSVDFSTVDPNTYLVSRRGYFSAKIEPKTSHIPSTGLSVLAVVEGYGEDWIAYPLGSLKGGTYTGTVSCLPADCGAEFNFYIVPNGSVASITEALAIADPVAALDSYDAAVRYYYAYQAAERKANVSAYLPADGEYVLALKYKSGNPVRSGVGGAGIYQFNLKALDIKKTGDIIPEPDPVTRSYVFNSLPAQGTWVGSDDTAETSKWAIASTGASLANGGIGYSGGNLDIQLNVPASGEYDLSIEGYNNGSCSDAEIYFAPVGKDPASAANYKLGKLFVPAQSGKFTQRFGKVAVNAAGKYTLRIAGASVNVLSATLTYKEQVEDPSIVYQLNSVPTGDTWDGDENDIKDMLWQTDGTSTERHSGVSIEDGGLRFGNNDKFRFEEDVGVEWHQIKIKVPEAGTYTLVSENKSGYYCAWSNIYVAPEGEDPYVEANKVGKLYKYSENGYTYESTVGEVTFPEAGIYIVRFVMGRHSGCFYTTYKLKLVPKGFETVEEVDFKSLELIPSQSSAYVGEPGAYIRPVGYDSKGEVIDISEADITYSIENKGIPTSVTVEYDKIPTNGYANIGNYVYNVNGPGSIYLQNAMNRWVQVAALKDDWFAYKLGYLKEGEYSGAISCVPYSGGSAFNFYLVPEGDVGAVNEALKTATPFVTIDGYAPTSANENVVVTEAVAANVPKDGKYMIVGRYATGNVATGNFYAILMKNFNISRLGGDSDGDVSNEAVAQIDENGVFTGNAFGITEVTARVSYEGFVHEASCPMVVEVREEGERLPIVIDFADCAKKGHSTDPLHATCEECGWWINLAAGSDEKYIEEKSVDENGLRVKYNDFDNDYLSIDIPVEQGGYYEIELTYPRRSEETMGSWHVTRVGRDGGAGGWLSLGFFGNRKAQLGGLTVNQGATFIPSGTLTLNLCADFTTTLAAARVRLIPVNVMDGAVKLSLDTTLPKMNVNTSYITYVNATFNNGSLRSDMIDMQVRSLDPSIVEGKLSYNSGNNGRSLTISTYNEGSTSLVVDALVHGEIVSTLEIPITVKNPRLSTAKIVSDNLMVNLNSEGMQLRVEGTDPLGEKIGVGNENIVWTSANKSVATVDENGWLTPVAVGEVKINAIVKAYGFEQTVSRTFSVRAGKTKRTYYTDEKVANALENISKYTWAKKAQQSAIAAADKYVELGADLLWKQVTSNNLPRSAQVGYFADPACEFCRYCKTNLVAEFGNYSWMVDPINQPWKVTCPKCRRSFPSNDFASFYELGIGEDGQYYHELALAKNEELVASGHGGYLVNKKYPEMDEHIDEKTGELVNEGVHNWGVDDGFGYLNGGTYFAANKTRPSYDSYIAYYIFWGLWRGGNAIVQQSLASLMEAYVLTDDPKYGRIGAIITDRIADMWPTLYLEPYSDGWFSNFATGKAVNRIWDTGLAELYAKAYDAFYNMYDDEYVVNFLSEKKQQYPGMTDKSSPEALRQNCEDGILRQNFIDLKNKNLEGNFGHHQITNTITAIVLDSAPETEEMFEWMFFNPEPIKNSWSGGIWNTIFTYVDRDGMGNEAAPGYNGIWIREMGNVANTMAEYGVVDERYDLYKSPLIRKMYDIHMRLTLAGRSAPQIGDCGSFAKDVMVFEDPMLYVNAYKVTGDPKYAQFAYFLNGNSSKGLKYDIYTKNPESPERLIADVIAEHGEYDGFNTSDQLAGYGFTILRGGDKVSSEVKENDHNTLYDYWMYYGYSGQYGVHPHDDPLSIGIDAYGTYMANEFGYPSNWSKMTPNSILAHNTVQIDDKSPQGIGMVEKRPAFPMHFDDSGLVKVMDVDASIAYEAASKYRRTLVAIEASEDVSYAVDLFRVTGGNKHTYSFYPVSNEIYEMTGLDGLTGRPGTYAGENVEFGSTTNMEFDMDSHITDIREDFEPDPIISVDYKILDFRNYVTKDRDLHLRMTMLGADQLSDLTLGKFQPPQIDNNPEWVEGFYAHREGKNLTSLFHTVFEPYDLKEKRYIDSIEPVPVTRNGNEVDRTEAAAVKVTLANGRVDYIVNTENTSNIYRVDDLFDFQGFLGVYMLKDGELVCAYGNDAAVIGDYSGTAAVNGTVTAFTEGNQAQNYINVAVNGDVDLESLAGKWIYVDNDKQRNAAYPIEGARDLGNGEIELDIGDITLVKGLKSIEDGEMIFDYNIKKGQTFRIPMTIYEDSSPIVEPISKKSVVAGKKLTFTINATSPVGRDIEITAKNMPRGAVLNGNTITWIPDSNQIGSYAVAVEINDGVFKKSEIIPVQVYKGSGSSGGGAGGSGGGGASGGGASSGGGSSSGGSTDAGSDSAGGSTSDGSSDVPSTETPSTDDTPTERFTDLGNYAWAKDAIYALVEKGVVNGTSESTFSPAANIKRADFAIMLVRAFGITEGEGENFADVDSSKYYAEELRLAKVAGIVNGIGNDKFNPEGQITRQDMMLMLSRALDAMEIELAEADASVLAQFSDAANIADYARDAVPRVVKAGVITGSNGKLNPLAQATRAEVAVMLSRVLGK